MTRSRLLLVASILLALPLSVGCSSSSAGGNPTTGDDGGADSATGTEDAGATCTSVLPATCPSPEPAYQADVLPILEQRCYTCHADAGITTSGSGIDLGSYDAVYKLRGDVESEINGCRMPPSTAPQTTATERATLLGWIVCEAPDN